MHVRSGEVSRIQCAQRYLGTAYKLYKAASWKVGAASLVDSEPLFGYIWFGRRQNLS
jgi:hypothetical protein